MRKIIDFHSHVLPGIDDGSASVEESLALLRLEARSGIPHVIATPHFYPRYDTPEHFLRKRAEAEKILRQRMAEEGNMPKLSVGAEVYYFAGISESDVLTYMTMGSTKYVLLEMPQSPWTDSMYREIEAIHAKQGLIPIIAHVDRYISPFRTFGIPERLEKLPVVVQANASFFIGKSTRRMALRLLDQQKIHLLGSDCHNMSSRPPNLGDAIDIILQRLGSDAIEQIEQFQKDVMMDRVTL